MTASPMLNDVKEPCVLLVKSIRRDDMGTYYTEWSDGAEFDAWFELDSSTLGQIAEQQGVQSLYTFYVPRDVPIAGMDAFKRKSDAAIFRVTSDGTDAKTPSFSAIDMRMFRAERWELPT